jgi:iron complex transport system ATP-binding protein
MLAFKNLEISFDKVILQNVSGEIAPASVTFLVGPNGSGKTSLLKALGGILKPKKGEVQTTEEPVYLSSQFYLQNGLTGHDLFDLYDIRNSKWPKTDELAIDGLLSRPLETLSSGERQRVLLSAVLFHKSSVVLLDEPLSHLDWNFSLKLKQIIDTQTKMGRSFIISNHDLHWILNFDEAKTWVLFEKTIVLKGSTKAVFNDIKLRDVFKIKTDLVPYKDKNLVSFSSLD